MAQADRVHSTPPTNTSKITPVDPTRRHLLTVAAAGAAALAIAPACAAASAVDPIYAVIERHRKTCAAHNEAIDIHMDFEELGMRGEKLEEL
jgi:hypothetical protein